VLADQVRVDWDDQSNNESYFRIEVDSGTGYRLVGQVDSGTTFLVVSGLAPLTTYRFRVQAGNDDGLSAWAVSAPATTLATVSWRIGRRTSTAAVLYYDAPDATACTVTAGGASTPDGGGVRARQRIVAGLMPESVNSFSILCAGASASGEVETPAASTGMVTTSVVANAPSVTGVDNLTVQIGAAPDALVPVASTRCTGRCSVKVTVPVDTVQWVRYRWCRNAEADPLCQNAGNELTRSEVVPLLP
jgi:hypothetical protein